MKVHFFKSIPIALPYKKIFSRLGHVQGLTRLNTAQRAKVDRYINEAGALVELRGASLRCKIRHDAQAVAIESADAVFKSAVLSGLVKDCAEIMLLGATAGETIVNAIAQDILNSEATRAVVFDAVAGEMTDAALDWITRYWNQELRRENKALTKRRMSAGYGDFRLENQKTFYTLLDLQRLGVTISEQYILIPEKSVTAVAGIVDDGV